MLQWVAHAVTLRRRGVSSSLLDRPDCVHPGPVCGLADLEVLKQARRSEVSHILAVRELLALIGCAHLISCAAPTGIQFTESMRKVSCCSEEA